MAESKIFEWPRLELVLQWDKRVLRQNEKKTFLKTFEEIGPSICTFLNRYPGFKKSKSKSRIEAFAPTTSLTVTFCGDQKMCSINREYRGKDKTTDVLSFPIHDDLRSTPHWPFPLELGDIIISMPKARAQAHSFEVTLNQEIIHLVVHGLLHLLGYDHEISAIEEKEMFDLEEKLVHNIYKILYP